MKTIVIIDDVTPNRATVVKVIADASDPLVARVRHERRYNVATLAHEVSIPSVGERVWLQPIPAHVLCERVITGREYEYDH